MLNKLNTRMFGRGDPIKNAKEAYNRLMDVMVRGTSHRKRDRSPLTKNISGNDLMASAQQLKTRITPENFGQMIAFYYDPKNKDKLDFYDRFPLVIPIESYNDGFLGLNLHYLPPRHRAILLDAILDITEKNPGQKGIRLTYDMLKGLSKTRLYIPCIKRYLYKPYVKSKIYIIPRDFWFISIFLPIERFEKANKQTVYRDSLNKAKN